MDIIYTVRIFIYYRCFSLYTEIFESFNSPPVPAMIRNFAATKISTNSQRSTAAYHTSSVSSLNHTTTSVNSITQLPKGVLDLQIIYSNYTYITINEGMGRSS